MDNVVREMERASVDALRRSERWRVIIEIGFRRFGELPEIMPSDLDRIERDADLLLERAFPYPDWAK